VNGSLRSYSEVIRIAYSTSFFSSLTCPPQVHLWRACCFLHEGECSLTRDVTLMEDEPEKYQSRFSEYIKVGVDPENIEELYKKVHSAIHADPTPKKLDKQPPKEHKR
ncbi:Ribosomal protein L5 eukaryotic/L18 archaeal, partial [Cynara cardunculus var. scolymus]